MLLDLISLLLAFVLSYRFKFGNFDFLLREEWLRFLVIVFLLNIVITFYTDPYSGILRRSYYEEIYKSAMLAVLNGTVTSVILYLFKIGARYSRELVLVMYAVYFLLSVVVKYVWKKLLVTGRIRLRISGKVPLFIIANGRSAASAIRNTLAGDFRLYDIRGVFLADGAGPERIEGVPVVRGDPVSFVLENGIQQVLLTVPPEETGREIFRELIANGVYVSVTAESVIGMQAEEQFVSSFGVYKAFGAGEYSFTPTRTFYIVFLKRILDILTSIPGILLVLPVALIVRIGYSLSGDYAPVFYSQDRIGLNGKRIRIFKFRTMVPDAEERLKELLRDERYCREWEEGQKFGDDPRVTRIGGILRRMSIDELPQVFNVFVGSMSIVGPRPLVEGELEGHGGLKLYQKVKPGITGWWACNGRSNIGYRERLELEYYYVKNCSFYLDLLCIFRTMIAVLRKDGAK